MNFEMACEIVEAEGIKTKKVIVADDIASASEVEKEKRRGRKDEDKGGGGDVA